MSADQTTIAAPPKKVLTALEKVFAAEIEGRLPFQSKASIYRDLLAAGLVSWMERKFGTGVFAVAVTGYALTQSGRLLYCTSCDATKAPSRLAKMKGSES